MAEAPACSANTAMLETQVLASGLIIRQDFTEAVRPVFFQTEYEEFLYATHGGTLFLVVFRGRVYGVTCAHVFGDFPHGRLFVAQVKRAQKGSSDMSPASPIRRHRGTTRSAPTSPTCA